MEEQKKWYESDKKICRHNIQRDTCRQCLFETLCDYEDNKAKNEWKEIQNRFIS